MKESRKILALILSVLMLMTMFIPTAFAYENEEVIYFEEESAPDAYENIAVDGEASADIDWDAVFASMATQFDSHSTKIDFSEFNIPKTDANKQSLYNFCWYYPQNLRGISSVSIASTSQKYCYITPTYSYTDEEYSSMIAGCEDAIETLLYGIEGNTALSDDEKLLILHDRMATWCEYDYDNYLNDSIPDESCCAYGPLVLKFGVCEGISQAYSWMLNRLGFENYYTTSDTICHGWNMVYINGVAYYVDITHDDPVWDRIGRVNHDYFLVTYSTYSEEHNNATDFSAEPDSTYFEENGFWNDSGYSSTEAQIINGKIYYIKNNSIVARDCESDAETTVKTLSGVWYASAGSIYSNKFHCLASVGTKLIYNTPTEIRSYDTATGTDALIYAPDLTAYAEYTYIYALTQKEGVIYYWLNNTPDQSQGAGGTILTYNYCTEHTSTETLEVITPATCTVQGEDKVICKDCRAVFTKATGTGSHSYKTVETVAPTCTDKGYTVYSCTNCGDTYKADYTDAKGHSDGNGDGTCDECGENLQQSSCSCGCHKSGISGFFFKIKLLFWKLFNIESHRYCDCGKAHW